MIALGFFVLLFSLASYTHGVGFRGFTYEGLKEPEFTRSYSVKEKWIQQRLDHFNHRDNRTWSMRYMENDAFYKENGPILIMLGGEWEISGGFLTSGIMYEIASAHKAMMYYTEHRYYGKSRPTEDASAKNMQYLNVDQALADVAYFIERKKEENNLRNSTVVVFGGSYAGNMAAWARLKYPHLIQGALASSAPVRAQADFPEYYEVVTNSLRRYSEQCVVDVKNAFDTVEKLLLTQEGVDKLKDVFNLCERVDTTSASDVGYFMNILAEKFAGIVQYDAAESGKTHIATCCDHMSSRDFGSPLERLARLIKPEGAGCLNAKYQSFLHIFKNESWDSDAAKSIIRQWNYQTCTEYGYYQTTNSKKSVFGTLFPLDFFVTLCKDLYGEYYNKQTLNNGVERTNIMYGSLNPDVRNIIFTNGDVDPWHALSVLEDLCESSPAILIKGSSHCRDLYSDQEYDVKDLKEARQKVRNIIGGWLAV